MSGVIRFMGRIVAALLVAALAGGVLWHESEAVPGLGRTITSGSVGGKNFSREPAPRHLIRMDTSNASRRTSPALIQSSSLI